MKPIYQNYSVLNYYMISWSIRNLVNSLIVCNFETEKWHKCLWVIKNSNNSLHRSVIPFHVIRLSFKCSFRNYYSLMLGWTFSSVHVGNEQCPVVHTSEATLLTATVLQTDGILTQYMTAITENNHFSLCTGLICFITKFYLSVAIWLWLKLIHE